MTAKLGFKSDTAQPPPFTSTALPSAAGFGGLYPSAPGCALGACCPDILALSLPWLRWDKSHCQVPGTINRKLIWKKLKARFAVAQKQNLSKIKLYSLSPCSLNAFQPSLWKNLPLMNGSSRFLKRWVLRTDCRQGAFLDTKGWVSDSRMACR